MPSLSLPSVRLRRRGRRPGLGWCALAWLIMVSAALVPSSARAEPTDPTASVQAHLDRVVAGGTPGVSAALLKDGEVLTTAAAGEDGSGNPMRPDTPMRIESLSKSFTALAVMQLVDEGRVDLDQPVTTYLPEFTVDDSRGAEITVADLLSHTSGLSDAGAPDLYDSGVHSLTEAVARLETSRMAADPGTQSNYHNPNYHVAARLVEVVSGQPFADHLAEHVFDPAGMTNTVDTPISTDRVPEMARGHLLAYGRACGNVGPSYFTEGSGGIVSTAEDLARWLQVQTGEGRTADGTALVSPEAVRAMHTPRSEATWDYGYGWYNAESAEGPPRRISHSGAGAGFGAYQGIFGESGYAVALLINSGSGLTSPDAGVLAQNLIHAVDPEIPPLSSGADGGRTDWILTALGVVTVGLVVLGIARSRRWATRRLGRNRLLTGLRLVPALLPIMWFLALPSLQLLVTGRTAPYRLLFTVSPVGLTWFAVWAATCAILTAARIHWAFRLRAVRSGVVPPATGGS